MIGRRLPFQQGSATWNMSVDQVLLASTEQTGNPCLRFYGWSQPTVSLGYFQSLGQRNEHARSLELPIVRRSTGGGAIVHDRELTYSLAMPIKTIRESQRLELYRKVHESMVGVLSDTGVVATPFRLDGRSGGCESEFLCFRRRTDEDLIVSGYKILGSAQRKARKAILQHGSLLLASSPAAPELPGIAELTGKRLGHELEIRISSRLGELLGIQWINGELSDVEHEEVSAVQQTRFASQQWLTRRP